MISFLKRLGADQSGSTTVEHSMLTATVAMSLFAATSSIGQALSSTMAYEGSALAQDGTVVTSFSAAPTLRANVDPASSDPALP